LLVEGSLRQSRHWFDAAYSAAVSAGQPEEMAQAALGLSGLWVHEHRGAVETAHVEERLRRALSSVNPASEFAMRLRTRLAAEADYRRGRHAAVLAAVEQASRTGHGLALAEALNVAHHCLLGPEHVRKRLMLAGDLLRVAWETGRRIDVLMGLLWRTVDLFLAADPQAERSLSELRRVLAHEDHQAVGFVTDAMAVMLEIRQGRFTEAEMLAGACFERGVRVGDADAEAWHGAQLAAIRWYQGRSAELVPSLARQAHSPTLGAADITYFAALAAAAAAAGDRRQAACALARLRGRHLRNLPSSSGWLLAIYGAIEASQLLGDRSTAAEAYSLLRRFADLPIMGSLAVVCFGSAHYGLGLAALTIGEPDRAVKHFQLAVCRNQALEHWPAVVLSRHRLGQALAGRGGPGDAALASAELAAAAGEAFRLGMALPVAAASLSAASVPALSVFAASVPAGSQTTAAEPSVVCRRLGRSWHVQVNGRAATVADCVGMGYLAILLAHPGREIAAAELAAGAPATRISTVDNRTGARTRQPILDDVALRQYRGRLSQLQADIEEYEAMNDPARAEAARTERDWLATQVRTAVGLGGRGRQFSDDAERARVAVGKAIRRALDRLAAADPVLGEQLRNRIQTGTRCCFTP
jgi:tetratricopeptide (TPR) repeat protein